MVQMDTLIGGRYQIINDLGKGGFGETFLAKDTHLPSQKLIVIKRLHQLASDQKVSFDVVTDLFKKEAEVLEDLGQHSASIPSLYAYFVEDEQFYLVQEYIEGQSLVDLGIISSEECRRILTSLLKTLKYIHSKKIIHRDIKPENILIRNSDREPVLIDFGAVKETMGTIVLNSRSMVSSVIVGTQGFMPPEQSTGRTIFSSDLFALGLTMIYSLTGKYPSELRNNSLTGEVEWQSYVPNLDRSLQAVLEKATKIDVSKRYLTAEEMLQDLNMSGIHTVVVIPKEKNIPAAQIGVKESHNVSKSSRTKIAYAQTTPLINNIPKNFNNVANLETRSIKKTNPQSIPIQTINGTNFNSRPSNWFSIFLTALLVGAGVSAGFIFYLYVKDTQVELANIEQQKTEMEAQLEVEQQKRLEEENKRLQAEKLRREVELQRIQIEQQKEKQRLEQEKLEQERQKQRELEETSFIEEVNPDQEISPESTTFETQDAIDAIQRFYNLVSQKQYNQARNYFADPNVLDPKFFDQFTQVTVTDLQVTEKNEQSFTLLGTNTYYYPDGTTQTEKRDYTLKSINNQLKITASTFIRVIKFRS